MTMIDKVPATLGYAILFLIILLAGCATPPTVVTTPREEAPPAVTAPPRTTGEFRSDDYVVLTPLPGDSYESMARTYLGNERLAYLISEFNDNAPVTPGQRVVIPLRPENPGGIYGDGYLTVPVLCYHRFQQKRSQDKITVSEDTFNRQMAYLKNNGYSPITLRQLSDFIDSRQRPPQKSVLITIDDGLKSVRSIAYPILKRYGFPAVLFINTDTIQTKQNPPTMTWDELRELRDSGLFEIESHSASHVDLTKLSPEQMQHELSASRNQIRSMLGITTDYLAYPFGLFNRALIDALRQNGYRAAFTVIRWGNPFFAHPYALNRSMVYNSDRIEDFARMLDTYRREEP